MPNGKNLTIASSQIVRSVVGVVKAGQKPKFAERPEKTSYRLSNAKENAKENLNSRIPGLL
jgi:hypothetical protein